MASSSNGVRAAVTDGWRRVAAAWGVLAGVLAAVMLVTAPAALLVKDAIEQYLGSSAVASRVAAGPDMAWWDEFQATAPPSFTPGIVGGAAPLGTYSDLIDGAGLPLDVLAVLAIALVLLLFLTGGVLERLARRRRLGSRGFLGACGAWFFRLVRLTAITGLAYLFVLGPLHAWLFDGAFPWITRDTTVERTAALWRALLYAVWLAPLLAINLLADYAKVRLVIEDRHSVIGAVVAAARFLRRHWARALGVYAVNALIALGVFLAYLALAPGGAGGDWRLLLVLLVGVTYLAARIAVRAAFVAGAMALFERTLAHAEYTAPPLPVWPDSPAAEAIDNAARLAQP